MFTYSIKFLFLIKIKTVTRFKEIFIIQIAFHLKKNLFIILRTEKIMYHVIMINFFAFTIPVTVFSSHVVSISHTYFIFFFTFSM